MLSHRCSSRRGSKGVEEPARGEEAEVEVPVEDVVGRREWAGVEVEVEETVPRRLAGWVGGEEVEEVGSR